MNVIPKSDVELMEFVTSHLPVWSADPAGVGLSGPLLAELSALQDTALASRRAADAARQAALAATLEAHADARQLRDNVSVLVKTIKAFAERQATPANVYAEAQIPAPKKPGPTAPPPVATDVSLELEPGGGVRVHWKAAGGSPSTGCMFKVLRAVPGVHGGRLAVVGLGTSRRGGRYTFVDETLPPDATSASYAVVAVRGNREGPMSTLVSARFGVGGGTTQTIKLAA